MTEKWNETEKGSETVRDIKDRDWERYKETETRRKNSRLD